MTALRLTTWLVMLVALAASVSHAAAVADSPTAPPDNARDQVAAASRQAINSLREQIGNESIGQGLTVNDLLKKTGSNKTFMKTVCRAQQIGGPRWINPQACQVRLELPGHVVATRLVEIATLDHLESPVAPEVLQHRLRSWDNRTFSATGTSAAAGVAAQLQPGAAGGGGAAWANVSDEARKQAVAAARKYAAAQVLDMVSPIPLGAKQTVGDVLKVPAVRQDVEKWLDARPITEVVFDEDQQVRLTLAVPGDELFDAVRASAERNKAVSGVDAAAWNAAREEFAARVGQSAARGEARAGDGGGVQRAVIEIPRTPPAWAQQQIDAVGSGTGSQQLQAARAAELDASKKLRGQLEALQLVPGVTIGEAARQDKSIAQAVDRAVRHARRTRSEFPAAGTARVTMTLDLNDAWDEIQSTR